MSSNFLFPTNSIPTRTTLTTATNIDLIFTNNISNFTSGVLETDISDHNPIFIIQSISRKNIEPNEEYVCFQNTSTHNLSKFKLALSKQNWSSINCIKDCDLASITIHDSRESASNPAPSSSRYRKHVVRLARDLNQ